jgi:hypothetical protein
MYRSTASDRDGWGASNRGKKILSILPPAIARALARCTDRREELFLVRELCALDLSIVSACQKQKGIKFHTLFRDRSLCSFHLQGDCCCRDGTDLYYMHSLTEERFRSMRNSSGSTPVFDALLQPPVSDPNPSPVPRRVFRFDLTTCSFCLCSFDPN